MNAPLKYRRRVPLFYDKSETEIQQDPYERFDPTVMRQSMLHLCDEVWDGYPMQAMLDFFTTYLPDAANNIVEVGCGVGRWIAELAKQFPKASCWGMDYSYQMLRQASDYWLHAQPLSLNLAHKGYAKPLLLNGQKIPNLQFGLAKAAQLPFGDNTQELVAHSFLFDRLPNPQAALKEFYRVLRTGGLMFMITPLNFHRAEHWSKFYPPVKLYHSLVSSFDILDWKEGITIEEQLDLHGNVITWKCLGAVLRKK